MRLFVSVDLEEFAPAITSIQEDLTKADGLRPTDPEQTHVTLKFLGDTGPDRLEAVEDAIEKSLKDAKVKPFDAECAGLGVFPSLDYISVVWVGFRSGGTQLQQLHDSLEERLTGIGFDPEEHDFTPHATIARMDHAGGKEHVQEIVQSNDPTVGTAHVEEISLTESTLTSDGPVYSTVESFSLG